MAETRPSRPVRRPTFGTWRTRLAGGLVAAALVLAALALANHMMQNAVTLTINSTTLDFRTRAETVQDALDDAGVVLDPEDRVWPPLDSALSDGDTITVYKARAVALHVGGDVRTVRTQSAHPLDILAEQGITVGPHDVVQADGDDIPAQELAAQDWIEPPTSLRVVPSMAITVQDSESHTVHTTQTDVGRVLDAAGFKLYLADRVTPDLNAPVTDGLRITIERSVPLAILADGQRLETRALGPTVGDAMAAIGLAPIGQDYTIPPLEAPLEAGMTIELVRVTEEVVTRDEPIPFDTIYHPDATLPRDEKRVIQEGVDGVRTRAILVRYENGQEVSRVVQDEWVARPPTPRMIVLGERDTSRE